MLEARRLLRHVIPGFLFALETLLLLFVWDSQYARGLVCSLANNSGLGGGITAVLASGAVGFFLAMSHHSLLWWCTWYGPDYRPLAKQLGGVSGKTPRDKRRAAWRLVHAGWCARLAVSQEATAASESLTDQMHSLGTAFVGAILSPLAVLLLWAWPPQPYWPCGSTWPTVVVAAVVWIALCGLHLVSYREVREHSVNCDRLIVEWITKKAG